MSSQLSEEWNQYVREHPDSLPPTSISSYKAYKHNRGTETQSLLNTRPAFALLAGAVSVANSTITLPELPECSFPVRVYKPTSSTKRLPIMLYFHGGYYVAGDANSEDLGCRAIIARGNQIVIVSFCYRLIPDVSWSTQFTDVEYALKYVAANASSFGGNTDEGFLIGGAEAGAHLAALCAIRARDRYPHIKLTGQVLIVPTLLAWPDTTLPEDWKKRLTSHIENADAPVLSEASFEAFIDVLDMAEEEKRMGENFPIWAAAEGQAGLKGLPPAYLPMDECDPTRDQGFLYSELLFDAGVKTRTDYYRGLPNMFVQFPELETTLKAGGHLAAGVAWLLQDRK